MDHNESECGGGQTWILDGARYYYRCGIYVQDAGEEDSAPCASRITSRMVHMHKHGTIRQCTTVPLLGVGGVWQGLIMRSVDVAHTMRPSHRALSSRSSSSRWRGPRRGKSDQTWTSHKTFMVGFPVSETASRVVVLAGGSYGYPHAKSERKKLIWRSKIMWFSDEQRHTGEMQQKLVATVSGARARRAQWQSSGSILSARSH